MQEEWAVDDCDGIIFVVDGGGRTVCAMGENGEIKPWKPYVSAEDNAKHIVDCVNGCAGINPEAVKDLLAACEQALKLIGTDSESSNGCGSPEEVASDLRAAITKAEQK